MQWRPSALKASVTIPLLAGMLLGAGTTLGATMLGSAKFSDVPAGSYYDAAVGRLADQGVIKGTPEGLFKPGDLVSRADVAVMIDRAINGADGETASSRSSRSRSSSSSSSTSTSSSSSSTAPVVTSAGKVHFTTTGFNVAKGSSRATITVVRTSGDKGMIKVDYAFGGGTAVTSDYAPSSGTLSFAEGETTKNISVSLSRTDAAPQATLGVTLSNPTDGAVLGSPSTSTLTLLGVSSGSSSSSASTTSAAAGVGSLSFSANTYGIDEPDGALSVTVVRTGGSNGAVTVNYATSNGTATAGTNYTATQGTLNFAGGETSKTFSVQVLNNVNIDGNKTVNLTLSTPTGGAGTAAPVTAVLTIIDDEATPSEATGSIKFSAPVYSVTENGGSVKVTVLRQLGVKGTVTVNYATSDSTATGAADYTPTSGTFTFAPGETSKSFSVPILKDSLVESEEMINLSLSSITGPGALGEQATATIKIQ